MTITGNTEVVSLAAQLSKLSLAPHTFALTGSRMHGGATSSSDYDFYVESNNQVKIWLQSNHFEIINESVDFQLAYPDDPNIVTVYRWHDGTAQIDVQLVKDFKKKEMIEHVIYTTHATYGLDKQQTRRVWKAMYALLEHDKLREFWDTNSLGS